MAASDQCAEIAPIALSLESVDVRFGTGPAVLQAVSATVAPGEFISLVGPSGCGKTTVLRLIAGLIEPTSGRLVARGATDVAFVFQEPNLLPWRDVIDNVRLPLELSRVARSEQDRAIEESLRLVGLQEGDYHKYPRMLSGGMKMRVSLARALVTRPSVLLLDEPFAALDDLLRQRLNEDLLAMWGTRKWTAIFVTHNVAEAVFLSRRVLIMSAQPGTIVESLDVPFPYPRGPALRGEAEFARLTDRISQSLRSVAT
jgi:NitT/TauT family transport system ATP-binding protein